MKFFQNAPLQRKLNMIIMLTTIVALVIFSVAFLAYELIHFRQEMVEDLEVMAPLVGTSPTVTTDPLEARDTLETLRTKRQIVRAVLYRADGSVIAQYSRDGVPFQAPRMASNDYNFTSNHLNYFQNLRHQSTKTGGVFLQADLSELRDYLRKSVVIMPIVFAVAVLAAFAISARLQRVISEPIHELSALERKVTETRDFSLRAKGQSKDEIGQLVASFNEMMGEIQRREGDLRVAMERAEQANRTKSSFLANMSHELRTPLNAIIGYSEMLAEDAADSGNVESVADLQKIQSAGKHLLALINDILDISKIEAGKMELFLETFDVDSLIQSVEVTIKPLVEKNGNTLRIEKSAGLGSIHADATKTRQVLLNLLSNATKFTSKGNVTLRASRVVLDGDELIRFEVADSGIGMTQEQLGRLFQAFSQADASTSRKFGGTGLGLVISRRFCQSMGGDITVTSEPGRGSTFVATIPTTVIDRKSSSSKFPVALPASVASGPVAEGSEPGRVILVVDDDDSARELIERILIKEGFRVLTSANGPQAIEIARRHRPDVITLDVLMPEMNGWAVLATLKSDPELSQIPVIMLTMIDDRKRGFTLGAADYMVKPVDRDKLSVVLNRFRCANPPCTVLVVEDDTSSREILRHNLEKEGWQVAEAENGRVGLQRVAEHQPALILLDLMMPELDGFGFLRELRAKEAWRTIPVIVLTAKDLTPADHQELSGSVAQILQKGAYSREQLEVEIREVVNGVLRSSTREKGVTHG